MVDGRLPRPDLDDRRQGQAPSNQANGEQKKDGDKKPTQKKVRTLGRLSASR